MSPRREEAQVSLPSEREVLVTRTFSAPRATGMTDGMEINYRLVDALIEEG